MEELAERIKALPKVKYTKAQLAKARKLQAEREAAALGMCAASCKECHGLGWVRVGDGTLEMCPNVDRWKLPSATRYGITKDEADTLGWTDVVPANGIEPAIKTIKGVLDTGYGWIYLHGTYGIGKTLLLKIAVAEWLRKNNDAGYVRMAEILDHLRDSFDEKGGETETARLEWWSQLPLLAIDEFDRVRNTEYGTERKFVLMDRRYEHAIRQQSITLIASNEPPERMPGYLYDRVRDGRFHIIKIDGQSFRPGMDWPR